MPTAEQHEAGAPHATGRATGTDASRKPAAANLPALPERTPLPPRLSEYLDAAPEDDVERFAFALWEAGRKDEAVEFLRQEAARRRKMPRDDELVDVTPVLARAPASPTAADHSAIMPPPVPRRPFVLAGAMLAVILVAVFGGFNRLAAALPGFFGADDTAIEVASGANTEIVKTASVDPASVAPAQPDATPAAPAVAGGDTAEADQMVPPSAEEDVAAEDMPADDLPAEDIPTEDVAAAPTASPAPGAETAMAEPTAPEQAQAVAAISASDLARRAHAAPLPAAADAKADGASVTLQDLAVAVESSSRLPRPRPEPSPELVALLNAPAPRAVARVVSARTEPVVIPAAPVYPAAPRTAPRGPQRLTIIGRVAEVPPPAGWRWAQTPRIGQMRRALAERRAAIVRAWRSEPWPPPESDTYQDGPYADAAPYQGPYEQQVPWADPAPYPEDQGY